jgi:hypothetical protein
METRCACGNPLRDATFCTTCAFRLDEAIAQICEHHGLAWDLDIARAKQARITRTNTRKNTLKGNDGRQLPGTLRPTRTPYDPRATTAAKKLQRTLSAWAAVAARETRTPRRPTLPGPTCNWRRDVCPHGSCLSIRASRPMPQPPQDLPGLAAWLRPRVGWLRHHPDGQRAHNEIINAVRAARATIDSPAEKLYAGPCDGCSNDLYGRPGAAIVECTECDKVYDIQARRRYLLRSAEDQLASATEIARAITRLGQPVSTEKIRGYANRGRLLAHGQRRIGNRTIPLYRLGHVLDIITDAPQISIGPVCRRRTCAHDSCHTIRSYQRNARRAGRLRNTA